MYDTIIIFALGLLLFAASIINMISRNKIKCIEQEGVVLGNKAKSLERRLSLSERSLRHADYEYNELIEEKNAMEKRLLKAASHFEKLYLQKCEENKELTLIKNLGRKRVEKIKRLRSELSIANKSIRSLSEENKKLKSDSKSLRSGVMRLTRVITYSKQIIAKLRQGKDRLQKVVDHMQGEYMKGVTEIESLKCEIFDDQGRIQALKSELSTIKNMNKYEKGVK